MPDMGTDQPLGGGDAGAADAGFSRVPAQNCTLPSEGAVRTGGGRRCTAGRGTFGDGNGLTAAGSAGGGGGRTSTGSAAAGAAGGGDASGGGAGRTRGGCSQPPGINSALAETLTGSAPAVTSTIAIRKIGTFRISPATHLCTKPIAAYDNEA